MDKLEIIFAGITSFAGLLAAIFTTIGVCMAVNEYSKYKAKAKGNFYPQLIDRLLRLKGLIERRNIYNEWAKWKHFDYSPAVAALAIDLSACKVEYEHDDIALKTEIDMLGNYAEDFLRFLENATDQWTDNDADQDKWNSNREKLRNCLVDFVYRKNHIVKNDLSFSKVQSYYDDLQTVITELKDISERRKKSK